MKLLVVALVDLAERLSRLLEGASYILSVVDDRDLRHRIHEHQPQIVVLDWRMGGSAWRAVDQVAALSELTESQPYIIVVLPHASTVIDRENAKRGCYDVVTESGPRFERDITEAVSTAARARQHRKVSRRRVTREDYH